MIAKRAFCKLPTCILICLTTVGAAGDSRLSDSETSISHSVSMQTEAENKTRDYILTLTPLGSSPDKVLTVIQDVLHKHSHGYKKNYYTTGPEPPYEEKYVAGNIGILLDHDTDSSWLNWTATDTIVDWYFDDKDHLFNVTVTIHATGP
jgi:hypothetical protein